MDKRITSILYSEIGRQNATVELIASENFASEDVMKLAGKIVTLLA